MVDLEQLPADVGLPAVPFAPPPGSAALLDPDNAFVKANLLTKSQLSALARAVPDPVIDDLYMESTVNMLVGDSGLGKTPLLAQMAVSVATGTPFLGHATQPGRVLFCDAESAASHFVGYINAIEEFLGVKAPEQHLYHYMQNFIVSPEAPCSDFEVRLSDQIDLVKPKLVIVDCLRPFWPDAELKSDIAARVMRNLRTIATGADAAIILVHHRRKEARQQKGYVAPSLERNYREWLNEAAGSRALINQTDCRLGIDIAAQSGQSLPEETYVISGFSKHEGDILPSYFTRVYDKNGRPRGYAPAVPAFTEEEARIFNRLSAVYTFGEVAELKGGKSRSAVDALVKKFVISGVAVGSGSRRSRAYTKQTDWLDAAK